jgi:hypothetical protein
MAVPDGMPACAGQNRFLKVYGIDGAPPADGVAGQAAAAASTAPKMPHRNKNLRAFENTRRSLFSLYWITELLSIPVSASINQG